MCEAMGRAGMLTKTQKPMGTAMERMVYATVQKVIGCGHRQLRRHRSQSEMGLFGNLANEMLAGGPHLFPSRTHSHASLAQYPS